MITTRQIRSLECRPPDLSKAANDPLKKPGSHFPHKGSRAMALVTVLAMMVLLAILILSIFYSSQIERQSTALFAATATTKSLADTSVNLCILQLADATSQTNRIWISQPGLIRTFTGNRSPDVNYRLYSWDAMRTTGTFDPFSTANKIPDDWNAAKAVFVDINEPVPSARAPIDPAQDKYPVFYPPSFVSTGSTTVAGYAVGAVPGPATNNPVAMPVKWLYMLRDGTVKPAAPVPGQPSQAIVDGASDANPIVGRLAFWADDDSTKVNINTAAGGAFWNPPFLWFNWTAGNPLPFGISQPMRGEYQRYPGHPARTDLRAVFPELSWDDIYKIAPKVVQGGSENGLVRISSKSPEPVPDTDRLYASLGELRYGSSKINSAAPRQNQETGFASNTGKPWRDLIETRKAFLTVNSRAPELTAFGTPRVAIWPIPELDTAPLGLPYRTALDRLIAFCSTINSGAARYPFYFTRVNSMSNTEDINLPRNRQLFAYLQRLTSSVSPGVANKSFREKYGVLERDQILTEIFDYIRSTNIQDMQLDWNRMFNRWAVVVPTKWNPGSGETTGFGRAITVRQVGFHFLCNADPTVPASNQAQGAPANGSGQKANLSLDPATPTNPNGGTLQPNERRIQAMLLLELFSPSAGFKFFDTALRPVVRVSGLETFSLETSATPPLNLQFPNGNSRSPTFNVDLPSLGGYGGLGGAINYRWMYLAANAGNPHDLRSTGLLTGAPAGFPYISVPITLRFDPSDTNMTLRGGVITVEVFKPDASGNLTIPLSLTRIQVPDMTLPIPRLHPNRNFWAYHKSGIFGDYVHPVPPNILPLGTWGRFVNRRFNTERIPLFGGTVPLFATDETEFITRHDTVQTFFLPSGDYRQLFRPGNEVFDFVAVPNSGPYPNLRHMLSDEGSGVWGIVQTTSFVPDVPIAWGNVNVAPILTKSFYAARLPDVSASWTFGDWDIGSPMRTTDGPLINKPDEGNQNQIGQPGDDPYWFAYGGVNTGDNVTEGVKYHTANRQISSSVMFGSLPTGMVSGNPWQTLLFRPTPPGHPGAQEPPDHLLLDLFWMPVVEPYAISEPFSTAGKVNMNYQIVPFTYIERSTGMHAVLQNENILAVPETGWGGFYGKHWNSQTTQYNLQINVNETLTPFRQKLSQGGVFLTRAIHRHESLRHSGFRDHIER